MKLKLIHICNDEKFIDAAINQFATFETVESLFFIVAKNRSVSLVKKINSNVIIFGTIQEAVQKANASDAHAVVLHSIFFRISDLSKLKTPIILCCWGKETYYDINDNEKKIILLDLYKPKTRTLLQTAKSNRPLIEKIKSFIKKFGIYQLRNRQYKHFFQKLIAISTVLPEEFALIGHPEKMRFPLRYMSLKPQRRTIQTRNRAEGTTPRILVGNSLNATNNHADILEKLNSLGKKIEVVLPISYGGKEPYKKALKEFVSHLENIIPIYLDSFMERIEYQKILDSCDAAIFGHIRQQAVGNISYMISYGYKVFLYKESVCYQHFKNLGCTIFTIDDDLEKELDHLTLDKTSAQKNNDLWFNDKDPQKYIQSMHIFFENLEKAIR